MDALDYDKSDSNDDRVHLDNIYPQIAPALQNLKPLNTQIVLLVDLLNRVALVQTYRLEETFAVIGKFFDFERHGQTCQCEDEQVRQDHIRKIDDSLGAIVQYAVVLVVQAKNLHLAIAVIVLNMVFVARIDRVGERETLEQIVASVQTTQHNGHPVASLPDDECDDNEHDYRVQKVHVAINLQTYDEHVICVFIVTRGILTTYLFLTT